MDIFHNKEFRIPSTYLVNVNEYFSYLIQIKVCENICRIYIKSIIYKLNNNFELSIKINGIPCIIINHCKVYFIECSLIEFISATVFITGVIIHEINQIYNESLDITVKDKHDSIITADFKSFVYKCEKYICYDPDSELCSIINIKLNCDTLIIHKLLILMEKGIISINLEDTLKNTDIQINLDELIILYHECYIHNNMYLVNIISSILELFNNADELYKVLINSSKYNDDLFISTYRKLSKRYIIPPIDSIKDTDSIHIKPKVGQVTPFKYIVCHPGNYKYFCI